MYKVVLEKKAKKDAIKMHRSPYRTKCYELLESIEQNPYPEDAKLLERGLAGKYSLRINKQHRLVYEVDEEKKIVHILRMWSHYGD